MADTFLYLNGEQYGPYSSEEIREWVTKGDVSTQTLAWREGLTGWQPLGSVMKNAPATLRSLVVDPPAPVAPLPVAAATPVRRVVIPVEPGESARPNRPVRLQLVEPLAPRGAPQPAAEIPRPDPTDRLPPAAESSPPQRRPIVIRQPSRQGAPQERSAVLRFNDLGAAHQPAVEENHRPVMPEPSTLRTLIQRPSNHRSPVVFQRASVGMSHSPHPQDGYNRLMYVGGVLGNVLMLGILVTLVFLGSSLFARSQPSGEAPGSGSVMVFAGYFGAVGLSLAVSLWFGVQRLKNIGWPPVFVFLMLVPLVNLLMAACLIALPPRFARTKQLDAPAWGWLTGIALLALVSLAVAAFVVLSPGMLDRVFGLFAAKSGGMG